MATHFTVCVGVWVQGEGYGGARLPALTGGQPLRHRQHPQAMRKAPFALCTTSPSQRRREGHGGGGGGEEHGAPLALPVTRAVVPIHGDRHPLRTCMGHFCNATRTTVNSFTPGVSIVTREAGLAVGTLGVVGAVALAGVVVTVALQRVAMAVALTRHTATPPRQG